MFIRNVAALHTVKFLSPVQQALHSTVVLDKWNNLIKVADIEDLT